MDMDGPDGTEAYVRLRDKLVVGFLGKVLGVTAPRLDGKAGT